jgi:hypothetical protein
MTRQVQTTSTSAPLGTPADSDVALSVLVLVAFACTVPGMVASRRGRRTVVVCAGSIGVWPFLLFSSSLTAHVRQRGNGMFILECERLGRGSRGAIPDSTRIFLW